MTTIRDARPDDAAALAAVYAPHVLTGTASFETEPPTPAAMAARLAAVQDRGWPWLVAEVAGVVGYGYCGPFHGRDGYRFTGETSVYLRDDARGRGIGGALLGALIARAEARGCRQLVAMIGDSGNAASIALHARHGFVHVGVLRGVGWKFGRWLDVVYMQRGVGEPAGGDEPQLFAAP